MTPKVLKQVKQTKGVVNYAVKAILQRSTSGRYTLGKIKILFGVLLLQSLMQPL